jgi:hypothetical protein
MEELAALAVSVAERLVGGSSPRQNRRIWHGETVAPQRQVVAVGESGVKSPEVGWTLKLAQQENLSV